MFPAPKWLSSYPQADESVFPLHQSSVIPPEDIAATIYQAFDIAPETLIRDPLDRPHFVSTGTPIAALVG
jgi:hypothetical protein